MRHVSNEEVWHVAKSVAGSLSRGGNRYWRHHACAAVGPDRDEQSVRTFRTFTEDLQRLADWFAGCGIRTDIESLFGYLAALTNDANPSVLKHETPRHCLEPRHAVRN